MADDIIKPLKPGKSFDLRLFLRSGIEQKKSKGNGGPDVKLTLNDGLKTYPAKIWRVSEEEFQEISASNFLLVSGSVDQGDYEGEITIKSFEAAEVPEDVSPYLRGKHEDHELHKDRFDNLVVSVNDQYLRQLLDKVFDKELKYWPLFCNAYAAEKIHHAYPGGLLHHTVEVAELCLAACEVIPSLSKDLLVACALLHDLGKLDEMDHGLGAGEYTDVGILNGHIISGVIKIRPFMNKKVIPGFPDRLRETVTHMIVSHHGLREYGSPQLPSFPEAHVLSQCDMISARVFQYSEAIRQKKTWLPGKDNIRLYLGELGLQPSPSKHTASQPLKVFITRPERETTQKFKTTRLTIKGMVAAGSPDQSSEEEQETREVTLPKNGAEYLLRVVGDSMLDAGINGGDLLLIKPQQSPENGDIVVAYVDHSGDVVKRFRHDPLANNGKGHVWLESENREQDYPPIVVDKETQFRGKVVGILEGP